MRKFTQCTMAAGEFFDLRSVMMSIHITHTHTPSRVVQKITYRRYLLSSTESFPNDLQSPGTIKTVGVVPQVEKRFMPNFFGFNRIVYSKIFKIKSPNYKSISRLAVWNYPNAHVQSLAPKAYFVCMVKPMTLRSCFHYLLILLLAGLMLFYSLGV